MGSKIEDELLNATGYDYGGDNEQDYLKGLLKAVDGLNDDIYDSLSDEAVKWTKKGISNVNNRKPIPEFPDNVAEDLEDPDDEPRVDAEAKKGETLSTQEPAQTVKDKSEERSESQVAEDNTPVQVSAKPKRAKKPRAKPAEAKVPDPITGELVYPKDLMNLNKDKWGHIVGSKASQAMAMYERGTTSREITEKLGGKHYNVLSEAAKEGHHVEKEGGHMKVTHKDEFGQKAKGK